RSHFSIDTSERASENSDHFIGRWKMHFALESLERRLLLAGEPNFIAPLAGTPYTDWTIHDYVDLDPGPGIVDYHGGTITYDGNYGINFHLPTFASMDAGVNVFAGAAGTVTYVHDGEFDRNTVRDDNAISNEV